jgi:hypothetical protein
MVNLTSGTVETVYFTLKERQTLTSPNYLFIFTQRTTNREVAFVKTNASDTSTAKDRYNRFTFDVDQLFCGFIGEYHYEVREQSSTSNLDPTLSGKILETGMMRLNEAPEDSYEFTTYETDNTYVTR